MKPWTRSVKGARWRPAGPARAGHAANRLRADATRDPVNALSAALVPGLAATLFAGAAFTVPLAATAPAVRAGRTVTLPGGVDDAVAGPDGSLRVTTSSLAVYANETESTVGPGWRLGRPHVALPEQELGSSESAALTPTGVVSVYRSTATRMRRIEAVELRDGRRSKATTISDPGVTARDPLAIGGGGAVAVFFTAGARPADRTMFTFRPAGGANFTKPVVVDPQAPDLSEYVPVLGPDGSGAVVEGPSFFGTGGGQREPVRVRRITSDGTLGPWIPVGDRLSPAGEISAAIGPDGTVAIAMERDAPDGATGTLETTSLPPGATAVTPVQTLVTGGEVETLQENLSIAVGPGGQTAVTAADIGRRRLDVFTGPADSLARTGSFRANDPAGALVAVTADGGTTVAWSRTSDEVEAIAPLVASHRVPGGVFSRPVVVARTRFTIADPDSFDRSTAAGLDGHLLVPLSGGDAALTYYDRYDDDGDAGFRERAVRLRP